MPPALQLDSISVEEPLKTFLTSAAYTHGQTVDTELTNQSVRFTLVMLYYKQLMDEVFVISRIIKVEVSVIGWGW